MEVITIETESFYKLIQSVVERIKAEHNITEDKWISGEEAMRKLRISSKTTLQKLRNEGKVKFSQPERKIILYDVESIYQFLDKNSKRNILIMDLQEQYIEDYTSGFNHAYILAEYSPELLADIDQSNNPVNDYFEGFFAGKEHYQMEQEQSKELDELGVLRSNSKDRDKEFERE